MKTNLMILFLLIFSMIGFTGCSSEVGSANSVESNSSVNKPVVEPNSKVSETPTQVTKQFLEGVRQRQYGAVRELLSQRSLANLQEAANNAKTNLDQALKRVIDVDAQDMLANNVTAFEFRNEVISVNRATVEAKATNASAYARISLSKESGSWKINIDETAPVQ